MHTIGLLLAICLCGLACTRSGGGGVADGGGGGDDGGHRDGGPSDAGPHVLIDGGVLLIDGVPTYLYGGEVHYFRVRDRALDPVATQALWDDTLDRMVQAGMNVVTTYAPWDWHNPEDGVWDFEGAKDLGAFLDKACNRGLWVILKPGPFITAEWPNGFGSYGAVPAWWKAANPASLAKNSAGGFYDYSPLGSITQRQPSYFDPTFQSAVRSWYHQVLTVARPHLRGCLIGLQIDNETNLYWANHYGDADYSPTALANWHAWLEGKYGTIGSLNAKYQTTWTSFEQVTAPAVSPGNIDTERPHNPWFYDWYAGADGSPRLM
jgi:beta-galactosidase